MSKRAKKVKSRFPLKDLIADIEAVVREPYAKKASDEGRKLEPVVRHRVDLDADPTDGDKSKYIAEAWVALTPDVDPLTTKQIAALLKISAKYGAEMEVGARPTPEHDSNGCDVFVSFSAWTDEVI